MPRDYEYPHGLYVLYSARNDSRREHLKDVDLVLYGTLKEVSDFYIKKKDSPDIHPVDAKEFSDILNLLVCNDAVRQLFMMAITRFYESSNGLYVLYSEGDDTTGEHLKDVDLVLYGTLEGKSDFYVKKKDHFKVRPVYAKEFSNVIDLLVNDDTAWQLFKDYNVRYKNIENLTDDLRKEPGKLEKLIKDYLNHNRTPWFLG